MIRTGGRKTLHCENPPPVGNVNIRKLIFDPLLIFGTELIAIRDDPFRIFLPADLDGGFGIAFIVNFWI